MNVGFMIEWDNPKDRDRYKRYAEYTREGVQKKYPNIIKLIRDMSEKGVARRGGWADNTGHIINWYEFESMEVFSEAWNHKEWHGYLMELNPLVDNLRFRLLRPSVDIPEETT